MKRRNPQTAPVLVVGIVLSVACEHTENRCYIALKSQFTCATGRVWLLNRRMKSLSAKLRDWKSGNGIYNPNSP